LGTSAAQIEKPDEAIHAFQKAASLEPRNAQALYNMGKAMIEQGKLEEATESFSRAISLKPDYAKAYNNMGAALQAQGQLNEAIEAYTKAVSINPDFYDAYYNLGNALREQGKLKEAIEAYNKTLAIKPDSAKVIVNASSLRNQILDSSLINEEFEERLETPSLELSEEPKFPILQAIRAFLLSDQKLVRKHLRSYTGFTPSSIAKLV
jgi:tetratricopeptide (TPR) repeat protein